MVRIEFEKGGYLEVKDGTALPITFSVSEIRDISKKKGAFSKTVTLSDSQNNHNVLAHLYDVNVSNSTFDVNKIAKCMVLENDIPILTNAVFQLLSVSKKEDASGKNESVIYEGLVKDISSDFFTKMGAKELTDLDFSDLNHSYSSATVVATFPNTSKYKYLLPYAPTNQYSLKELKPAIFSFEYLRRIFESNGFGLNWIGIDQTLFKKTVIPYNGDGVTFDYSDERVIFDKTIGTSNTGLAIPTNLATFNITGVTEIQDGFNILNPTTGVVNSLHYYGAGESLNLDLTFTPQIRIKNNSPTQQMAQSWTSTTAQIKTLYKYKLVVLKNGIIHLTTSLTELIYSANVISPLSTLVLGGGQYSATALIPNLAIGDLVQFRIVVTTESYLINPAYGIAYAVPAQYQYPTSTPQPLPVTNIDFNNSRWQIEPSSNTVNVFGTQVMNRFVPKKIKQSDFVKSICTMFNLIIEPSETNENILNVQTRDDYYDSGQEVDWTNKLYKNLDQNIQFLPEVTAKKVVLSYKNDNDLPNETYYKAINEVYGEQTFEFTSEYTKDIERKEVIFSPTPFSKTSFGAFVPFLSGTSPKTNIRMLFDGGQKQSPQTFFIYDYGTIGVTGVNYPMLTHFNDATAPNYDLNFGVCDYYFTDVPTPPLNNLYNLYHRRTFNQINSGKLLTAYFDLRADDIAKLRLNQKIRIEGSWWNINQIIDYNANYLQPTKVELISIDDELVFKTFAPTKPLIVKETIPFVGGQIVKKFTEQNNVINNGVVIDGGFGNWVKDGIAEGSFKSVEKSSTWLNEYKATQPKKYRARINQNGTNPIVFSEIQDELNLDLVSSRISNGVYRVGGFTSEATNIISDLGDKIITDLGDKIITDAIVSSIFVGAFQIDFSNGLQPNQSITHSYIGSELEIRTYINGMLSDNVLPTSASGTQVFITLTA